VVNAPLRPLGEQAEPAGKKHVLVNAGEMIIALGIAFVVLIPAALVYMAGEFVWTRIRPPHRGQNDRFLLAFDRSVRVKKS